MSIPFVLETTFARRLGRFDAYCRDHQQAFGLEEADMPLHGLDHLLARGGTIILPNKVLEDLTKGFAQPCGLELNAKGNASFPYKRFIDGIKDCDTSARPFLDYLLQQINDHSADHKVLYFQSLRNLQHVQYEASRGRYDLAGKILIVADSPLYSAGMAPLPPSDAQRAVQRNTEIEHIGNLLMPTHGHAHTPCCLLAQMTSVATHFLQEGKINTSEMLLNVSGFLSLLGMTGFSPHMDRLQKATEQYREDYPTKPIGNPKSTGFSIMLLQFIDKAKLGATTTIGAIERLAQGVGNPVQQQVSGSRR